MGFGGFLKASLAGFDRRLAKAYLKTCQEKPALLTFLFHGLFESDAEIEQGLVDPQQRFTLARFKRFLEYFSEQGYQFVTPEQILEGLAPGSRCALITFDDGYRSSFRALPLLKEFQAPAVFFISTDHMESQRCFWWDVYYRERLKAKATPKKMARERAWLKTLAFSEIEHWLAARFGEKAFIPLGELDRAVTTEELKGFAREGLVHIGNHTVNHAILPNLDAAEVRRQIRGAQDSLERALGRRPDFIAYPNGDVSEEVFQLARDEGLKLGITTTPGKNRVPLDRASGGGLLALRRYTLDGACDLVGQFEACRSDFSAFYALRNTLRA